MGGKLKDRYGIPAEDVRSLASRYTKQNLKEGFGTFDNFVKFCSEVGYERGMLMGRYNRDEPHGPDNTFFYNRSPQKPKKEKKPVTATKSKICETCPKPKYNAPGIGCTRFFKMWVENWNKNICVKKQNEQTKPVKQVFRYEHPDLVREGIVWSG